MTIDPIWFQAGTALIGLLLTILGIITWRGFNMMVAKQDDVSNALNAIGNRLTKQETWTTSHDDRDDERFHRLDNGIKTIWDRIERGSSAR